MIFILIFRTRKKNKRTYKYLNYFEPIRPLKMCNFKINHIHENQEEENNGYAVKIKGE